MYNLYYHLPGYQKAPLINILTYPMISRWEPKKTHVASVFKNTTWSTRILANNLGHLHHKGTISTTWFLAELHGQQHAYRLHYCPTEHL